MRPRRPRRSRRAVAAIAVAVAASTIAACAEGAITVDAGGPPTTGNGPDSTTTIVITPDTDDALMEAAFHEVEEYWAEVFPEVYGEEYEPLSGGLHPYGPDTDVPDCGGPTSYEDVADNAFYCPLGDFVAWDTTTLIPHLLEEYGSFTLAVVMAHEMGHAIQERAGVPAQPTVMLELMADCFAGSWTTWARDGGSETFDPSVVALDSALAGMLEFRDPLGSSPDQPGAHGTAFDRIGAFQDGFRRGADQCATYEDGNYSVVDLPFGSEEDFERQGDWPFEPIGDQPGIEELVLNDLLNYWSTVFSPNFGEEWDPIDQFIPYDPDDPDATPECDTLGLSEEEYAGIAFYCPTEDFAAWDEAELMPDLYDTIGDMGVGVVLSTQYSKAAQFRVDVTGEGLAVNQQADCFSGSWLASVYSRERVDTGGTLSLSPGDLDEAVIAFLRFRDRPDTGSELGTAFQRTAALRDGFLHGLQQCVRYL